MLTSSTGILVASSDLGNPKTNAFLFYLKPPTWSLVWDLYVSPHFKKHPCCPPILFIPSTPSTRFIQIQFHDVVKASGLFIHKWNCHVFYLFINNSPAHVFSVSLTRCFPMGQAWTWQLLTTFYWLIRWGTHGSWLVDTCWVVKK